MRTLERDYWMNGVLFMVFTVCGVVMMDWKWSIGALYFLIGGMFLQAHLGNMIDVALDDTTTL